MEAKFVSLLDVKELNPFTIRTIQRTKSFHFSPINGWARGVNYNEIEDKIVEEITSLIPNNDRILLIKSRHRNFTFMFEVDETNDAQYCDFSEELQICIVRMMDVAKAHNLTILTVGV